MHEGVEPGLDEDDAAHQLVEVDVVVEGEDGGEAEVAEDGDGVAEDEHEDEDGVEEEGAAARPGQQVEGVGGEAAERGEVAEVDRSLDEQADVDDDDGEQEHDEGKVVLEIFSAHERRNLVLEFLAQ